MASGRVSFTVNRPKNVLSGRPSSSVQYYKDDDDSSAESDHEKVEYITSVDSSGFKSRDKKKEKAPLVIPSKPNRDFREAALANRQRKALYAPGRENSANRNKNSNNVAPDNIDIVGGAPAKGGLSFSSKNKLKQQFDEANRDQSDTEVVKTGASTPLEKISLEKEPSLTDDQRAIKELLGGDEEGAAAEGSNLVIPVGEDSYGMGSRVSEKEAYLQDVNGLPEQPTLEDYNRIPVSEFGAAMLRGMGGNRPDRVKTSSYVPKPRPHLLGLGAKPLDQAIGKDAFQQRQQKEGKSRKEAYKFVPVMKREPSSHLAISDGGGKSDYDSSGSKRRHRQSDYDSSSSNRKKQKSDDDEDRYRRGKDSSSSRKYDRYRRRSASVSSDNENYRQRRSDSKQYYDYKSSSSRRYEKNDGRSYDRDHNQYSDDEKSDRKRDNHRDKDRDQQGRRKMNNRYDFDEKDEHSRTSLRKEYKENSEDRKDRGR